MVKDYYVKFVTSLAKYEQAPNYNRFLAGLHCLLWLRLCGDSWAHCWGNAKIYWFGKS